ncbi:MAG: arginine--tRNA ligase [Candidatus Nealsonbacteria bacterium]|nr:arginine--tRNA ligase [Candidatus Nealsonbacteria bacterium]
MRKIIRNLIEKAVKEIQKSGEFPKFETPSILVERSELKVHGDYTSNIAMKISGFCKKNPMEIANLLVSELDSEIGAIFEKIEIAEPGFINFFLSEKCLQAKIKEILSQKDKFGRLNLGRGKKVQVEFISANPTGPLTVANARGGPLGDTLANVLEMAGFKTEKAYYINDEGNQVLILGHSVLKDENAQYKGSYIDELNKRIKEKDAEKAGKKAAKIIIEEMIKKTVKNLGINYDEWMSEEWLRKKSFVEKSLNLLNKKRFLYQKEGALYFKSSQFGDERDRVVVKSDGSKTYLAGDIAYHKYKFDSPPGGRKFSKVIDIFGADHHGDVPGLKAAVEALGHKGKLDVIILQFVTVLEKGEKLRMSKRKGFFVTMDELLNEVGSDAVRFFFLEKSADTHLNFDLSLAKEHSEKNPVYYVQYSHARICSILRKSKTQNPKPKIKIQNLKLLNHPSESGLIKRLIIFTEVIEDTAKDYQVQRLPGYARDLAAAFNQFYRDCRVISEDKELTRARLALVASAKFVLKNTLNLMGISAPERM